MGPSGQPSAGEWGTDETETPRGRPDIAALPDIRFKWISLVRIMLRIGTSNLNDLTDRVWLSQVLSRISSMKHRDIPSRTGLSSNKSVRVVVYAVQVYPSA